MFAASIAALRDTKFSLPRAIVRAVQERRSEEPPLSDFWDYIDCCLIADDDRARQLAPPYLTGTEPVGFCARPFRPARGETDHIRQRRG